MGEKEGCFVDRRPEFTSAHNSACLHFGKSIYALISWLKDSDYTASLNHKKARELETMNSPQVSRKHLRVLCRELHAHTSSYPSNQSASLCSLFPSTGWRQLARVGCADPVVTCFSLVCPLPGNNQEELPDWNISTLSYYNRSPVIPYQCWF